MQLAVLGGHTDIVQDLADRHPLSIKFVTPVSIIVKLFNRSRSFKDILYLYTTVES